MPEAKSIPEPVLPEVAVQARVAVVHEILAELQASTFENVSLKKARAARKAALRQSKQARKILSWEDALFEHQSHPKFQTWDNPWTRELCFKCDCKLKLRHHIGLAALKSSPPLIRAFSLLPRTPIGVWTPRPKPRRDPAEQRARALLHQFLSAEQRWSLRASRSFVVTGQDGRTYEVTESLGVRLLVNGRAVTSYCIHPRGVLPRGDVMLAQKLLLETNIDHFLSTANATPLRLTGT